MTPSTKYFINLPKRDLHVHLSGYLSIKDIKTIYRELEFNRAELKGISSFFNFYNPLLWSVLDKIMTSPSGISYALSTALDKMIQDNVKGCEIIINTGSLLSGRLDAKRTFILLNNIANNKKYVKNINCKIRLGVNRRNGPEALLSTANLFIRSDCKLLAGIDLNGDESRYTTSLFSSSLRKIKKMGVPFTIHAGEKLTLTDSLKEAIALSPQRIGHGIAAVRDEKIIKLMEDKHITLEVCPTSNLKTRSVKAIHDHPIFKLVHTNIPIVLCTDNPGLFSSKLSDEYEKLYLAGMNLQILRKIAIRSLTV